jgi:hypothetical protein
MIKLMSLATNGSRYVDLKLPPEIDAALPHAARRAHKSKTPLLLQAVEAYLEELFTNSDSRGDIHATEVLSDALPRLPRNAEPELLLTSPAANDAISKILTTQ